MLIYLQMLAASSYGQHDRSPIESISSVKLEEMHCTSYSYAYVAGMLSGEFGCVCKSICMNAPTVYKELMHALLLECAACSAMKLSGNETGRC